MAQQSNLQSMNKFASVSSIHSMVSMGYLPPGHGYIPKKIKPDKPYGPSYITILNRTWRGPGRRWIQYALVALGLAIFFYISAALYFGHRNVQRLIVKNTEPLGACLLMMAICLTAATFRFIYQARLESNRWRSYVKFRPDGLFHVAPINEEYSPKDQMKLSTGTYGPRAVKEIPKPRYMKKSRPASRAGGRKRGPALSPLAEGDENVTIEEEDMTSPDVTLPPGWMNEKAELYQTKMADENDVFPPPFIDLSNMPTMPVRGPSGRTTPTGMITPSGRMTPGAINGRQGPGLERMPMGSMERIPPGMVPGRPTPGMERMPPSGIERMPQSTMGRMPPGGLERMPPGGLDRSQAGIERMPPGGVYSPEPRMAPGSARQVSATPPPRMVPGQDRTPPTRMAPGSQIPYSPEPRMAPGSGSQNPYSPEPRMVPGSTSSSRQAPEPRMVPGSSRQAPEPRMVPGSQGRTTPTPRMVPGSQARTTPTPRMVPGSQSRPAAGKSGVTNPALDMA